MMSGRRVLLALLVLAMMLVSVAFAEESAGKAESKKKVAVGTWLVKVQDQVKAVVKSVKVVHQQDPYVVYALVGSGFILGALFYFVLSPSKKGGQRKPSGFKRKQK